MAAPFATFEFRYQPRDLAEKCVLTESIRVGAGAGLASRARDDSYHVVKEQFNLQKD